MINIIYNNGETFYGIRPRFFFTFFSCVADAYSCESLQASFGSLSPTTFKRKPKKFIQIMYIIFTV